MYNTDFIRNISILVLIIAFPLLLYFLFKILYSSKKVKIHAQMDEIQKHISLDELEQKTSSWKNRGYNVSELETLIDHVRKH